MTTKRERSVAVSRVTIEDIVRQYGARFVLETIAGIDVEVHGHVSPIAGPPVHVRMPAPIDGKTEIRLLTRLGQVVRVVPKLHGSDGLNVAIFGPMELYGVSTSRNGATSCVFYTSNKED